MSKGERRMIPTEVVDFVKSSPRLADSAAKVGGFVTSPEFNKATGWAELVTGTVITIGAAAASTLPFDIKVLVPGLYEGGVRIMLDGNRRIIDARPEEIYNDL